MSYGKKVGKFKPKVPALQGHGSGRKKKILKRIFFFFNPLKKKQARAGPSVFN
jgi:hypothetical protein